MISANLATIIISVASAVLAISSIFYAFYSGEYNRRERDRQNRAIVNYVRERVERNIYRLNEKLVDSEKKWLDVNHLIASSQRGPYGNDFTNTGNPINFERHRLFKNFGIGPNDAQVDQRLVFTLMPFHPDFDGVFLSIRNACAPYGLLCLRGDENQIKGDLLSHILLNIVKANLIICVVDGRNPNVFYELGIAHGLDKNVIIIARDDYNIATDLKSNKLVVYKNNVDLTEKLEREIARSFVGGKVL